MARCKRHMTMMASGSPWRTHREPSGRPFGLAEGGGRGGHPDQNHVEEYRSANAHVQGGVQERSHEDCLRDEEWTAPRRLATSWNGLRVWRTARRLPRCSSLRRSCRRVLLGSPSRSSTARKAEKATLAMRDTVREAAGFRRGNRSSRVLFIWVNTLL